jgi:hypothetical protein
MTADQKYTDFCKNHIKDSEQDFFQNLANEFDVSVGTAYNIWYAPQRSWYKPEMMEEIIRLDKCKLEEFFPNFYTGEFKWNGKNFVEENE